MQEEGFPTLEEEARAGTERAERSGGLHKRKPGPQRVLLPAGVVKRGRLGCLLSRARDGVPSMSLFECQAHEFPDRVFYFIAHLLLFLGSSWVGNRAAFSDTRSNFHARVGYRTNVCRRRLASDSARASEGTPAQGALEDHHDLPPGSPPEKVERLRIKPSSERASPVR